MDNDVKIALGAAVIVAAVEYPISQRYKTVPETSTPARMAVAGAMAFAGALVAAKILR